MLKKTKKSSSSSFRAIKERSSLNNLDTETIVSHLSGLSREQLFTYPDKELGIDILNKFKKLEKKRQQNWPLPYLVSYQDFFSLRLKVSTDTLIPRPETEVMVQKIIDKSLEDKKDKLFIDIGTGSGAIIISLKKNIPGNHTFIASDISLKALKVARENIKKLEEESIITKKTNLLKAHRKLIKKAIIEDKMIIISANLPYLNSQEMQEESIQKEPKKALFSQEEGLRHYREMFEQLADIVSNKKIKDKKKNISLYCELNPSQIKPLKEILKKIIPQAKTETIKDLRAKDRFLLVKVYQ